MIGQKINKTRANSLISKGAILIDVRDPVSYRDGTIKGAINIPVNAASQLITIPKTSTLIFFGTGPQDTNLAILTKYASQLFNNIFYIEDMTEYL